MSTSQSTIDFLLDQLKHVRSIRVRKMFGDYALYCDEKVVALICDDQLFVKYTDTGKQYAASRYIEGCAYVGAKPSMNVTDSIDDADFIATLIQITAQALPLQKKKHTP